MKASLHCVCPVSSGVATGGIYRDIYPQNQSTFIFLCGCFVSLTQDKFDIVQFIPTQIKFLATPLPTVLKFVTLVIVCKNVFYVEKQCVRKLSPLKVLTL